MKDQMSSTIGKELSAGSLSDTDATALTSALTSIDTSLSADGASATTSGSTSKLDPSSMKDRIDGLISDQVSAGTLTDDQASELKNLFATGGQSVGSVTSDAAAGAAGPPPGPPPDGSDTDASSNGDASGTSSGGSSVSDLFSSFLKQLQATQTSSSAYGATGTSRNTYASSALLLDTNA
ncbi:hypothetical protein MKK64_27825 [Methylobacterium sp. E-025]|uniref:hypothetical protein n=1 Tax=Methylobacterium sp. E-025 TaxID=2836561 RepID=UPI001FB97B3A|nr:hypothetical protein [Methylobacterium sp. E-025]MCJ2114972.1 hypothetical protein [Methylobacterium sp. E-025]